MLTAGLPSIISVYLVPHSLCSPAPAEGWLKDACELALGSPIVFVNVLFFVNVSVGFWIIGLVQGNFWLIDPYWTFIPPLIGHFYLSHPLAVHPSTARGMVAMALVWIWSIRLTHNYFRREGWRCGAREDWRYTKMAKEHPSAWWILSFFAVGLAQQPMLFVGISLPLYSTAFSNKQWNLIDSIATMLCLKGILIAFVADNQLYRYMKSNEDREAKGQKKVELLDAGLWGLSRHPNYFGEIMWWTSFALFSVNVGEWQMVGGTVFNTLVLVYVSMMTEERMLKGLFGMLLMNAK
ncbi:hypothetical protein GUITHDRAFT_64145 [Guillardia theta CCMP2712]|uniref:Uncharacterized protein n=1 Tax=Guillardia theta (strain CCMP2712) TaxID=905079 RepID=L1JZ58_GUITC|nr:hypothetical protein GUITHDRAFT_64145 [Guillardia theta CCMP2712]EKX53609.1 hypothetical protein GUITHDRAFT_64145 [Guillardia theta CCMP2712]|eukprot:XP_005840589.1 hypothetical protein GUITHDRAFT_64145 [Guillardia theta CCMP2712]